LITRNRHRDRGGPNWMFLRLRTDEGLVGYRGGLHGFRSPFHSELLWRTLVCSVCSRLTSTQHKAPRRCERPGLGKSPPERTDLQ